MSLNLFNWMPTCVPTTGQFLDIVQVSSGRIFQSHGLLTGIVYFGVIISGQAFIPMTNLAKSLRRRKTAVAILKKELFFLLNSKTYFKNDFHLQDECKSSIRLLMEFPKILQADNQGRSFVGDNPQ